MSSNTRQTCHNIGSWVQIQIKHFTISLGYEFKYKASMSQYWVMSSDTSQRFHNIIRSWVQLQVKHFTIFGREFRYKSHFSQYYYVMSSYTSQKKTQYYWVMSSYTSQRKHNIIGSWVQILVEHFTKLLGHEFKYKSNISVHYIIRSWVRIQIIDFTY